MRIVIHTGRMKEKRERTFIFSTDENISVDYFTSRQSLKQESFPKYIKGKVEDFTDSSGGFCDWKEFELFDELRSQNIFSISVDDEDINEPILKIAKKFKATVKFPLIYHIQFFFEEKPDWVFNWYPTTGTLSKQKATEKFYRMINLGVYLKVEDALNACLKS